jgi:hypothetical protein
MMSNDAERYYVPKYGVNLVAAGDHFEVEASSASKNADEAVEIFNSLPDGTEIEVHGIRPWTQDEKGGGHPDWHRGPIHSMRDPMTGYGSGGPGGGVSWGPGGGAGGPASDGGDGAGSGVFNAAEHLVKSGIGWVRKHF